VTKTIIILILLVSAGCKQHNPVHLEDKKPPVHPLTDGLHVYVYTFIGRFLQEQPCIKPKAMQEWCEREAQSIHDASLKPHIADMYEGEIAGLLRVLLLKDPRYVNITLYKKDGVGIKTSGFKQDNLYFEARAEALNLGFLTPEILSGPKIYRYQHNQKIYEERILPIYSIYKESGDYFVTPDDKSMQILNDDRLIGYLSYIACVSNFCKKSSRMEDNDLDG